MSLVGSQPRLTIDFELYQGSSDSSIENVVVNDIQQLIEDTHITKIYTNGKKAHALYQKYCLPMTKIEDICLPSSSPANAAYSLERLIEDYQIMKRNE